MPISHRPSPTEEINFSPPTTQRWVIPCQMFIFLAIFALTPSDLTSQLFDKSHLFNFHTTISRKPLDQWKYKSVNAGFLTSSTTVRNLKKNLRGPVENMVSFGLQMTIYLLRAINFLLLVSVMP